MKKRTRIWGVLLTISLLLMLFPTTALAGGFETTTYAELAAKLAAGSSVDLDPAEDFGWPTESTTLYIKNEIYLMNDWVVPENITLVFTQNDAKTTNGRIWCSTLEPPTLTLNGDVSKDHSGNGGFLGCNIIFAGDTTITSSEYLSILVDEDFTWSVLEGASLTTQWPNYDGTAMIAGHILLKGALTGGGMVNSCIDLNGGFGGGPWDSTISGDLTITELLSFGYSTHDILTIPEGSTLTLAGNASVMVGSGTLNVNGTLKDETSNYSCVQIQEDGILHIQSNGLVQTENGIMVSDRGTLFLDQGGEAEIGELNTRAGSTFRLAGEYTTNSLLMLWKNVTNLSDSPEIGVTIQLEPTGVLHAYDYIGVSTMPREGETTVSGAINGSGTIMLHDGCVVLAYNPATGYIDGYTENPGTIPGVEATVKIIDAGTCTHEGSTWTVVKEPTCTENGVESRTCSACGATETRYPDALGHTSTVTDCTQADVCAVCGEIIRAAGEHAWDEGKITTLPTVDADGVMTYTCTRCGETKTETLDKLAEQEVSWIISDSITWTYGDTSNVQNTAYNDSEGGGALTYTSSNTDVATVDASGKATIVGVGTTTITVTAAAVPGKYVETSASYTLIVKPGAVAGDVAVEVTVEDGKAKITVNEDALNEIMETADSDVSIKLGGVKDTEELLLPGNLVNGVSQSGKGLTVTTDDSAIKLDNTVLDAVAEKTADEDTVAVRLTAVEEENLTENEKKALASIAQDAVIVEVSLIITHADGSEPTELHELGGSAEITVPYADDVPAGKYIVVSYLSSDGNATYVRATYNAATKQVTFSTNHFSHYAICLMNKTSGGGGGGSSAPIYAITVGKTENGSVTLFPKSAVKGDTVTITVKSDAGYALDTLKVLNSSGDEIKVTQKDGKYTFTMPASKITVEAAFVKAAAEMPFVDVAADAYYADAVRWAVENNVTGGTTATTFSPNAACTRAQTVTFLWRAMGSPESTMTANPFTDVSADAYYYKAVLWAVEEGITGGTTATTFAPNATVTRAQTVTFLWRAAESPKTSAENPFVDVAADAYYADAVLWAAKKGITSGTGADTFAPGNSCTRAQIVTFLWQYMGNKG